MTRREALLLALLLMVFTSVATAIGFGRAGGQSRPTDPGPRSNTTGLGQLLPNLSGTLAALAEDGRCVFSGAATPRCAGGQLWSVTGSITGAPLPGLGPRYATMGCGMCHAQPTEGGSSPIPNQEVAAATANGATNKVPSFITANGPTRIPYQKSTGALQKLYTIQGRSDAKGCKLAQPDFASLLANNDLSFHVPVPLYGVGLIESTPSANLIAAQAASASAATALGITIGRFNHNVGGISTIGWKGSAPSVRYFADLALSLDLDTTTEQFPHKSEEVAGCLFNPLPEDQPPTIPWPFALNSVAQHLPLGELTAIFPRALSPPVPASSGYSTSIATVTATSISNGQAQFQTIGCAICHVRQQTTGNSALGSAYSNYNYNPWSDFALHNMGTGLADGLTGGAAGPQDFRTPALWGTGVKLFFLHDGRTQDLYEAILAHSSPDSESNTVVTNYLSLTSSQMQDVLNFLRSL
jgi:CxxC motif-containing protein (DUF1111 family)